MTGSAIRYWSFFFFLQGADQCNQSALINPTTYVVITEMSSPSHSNLSFLLHVLYDVFWLLVAFPRALLARAKPCWSWSCVSITNFNQPMSLPPPHPHSSSSMCVWSTHSCLVCVGNQKGTAVFNSQYFPEFLWSSI